MLNRVTLIGRITKDLELRKTSADVSVITFDLACKNSTKQDVDPDYIRCVAFGQSADFLHSYAGKGDLILVEGRIQTRSYEDNEGRRIYVTDVISENLKIVAKKKQEAEATIENSEATLDDLLEFSDSKLFDE